MYATPCTPSQPAVCSYSVEVNSGGVGIGGSGGVNGGGSGGIGGGEAAVVAASSAEYRKETQWSVGKTIDDAWA